MDHNQSNKDKSCWYTSRRFRNNASIFLLLVIIYQGITGVFFRDNDFLWHFNHGQYFLEGDPYQRGGDWYTVGRMMMNSLLALQNYYVARAVSFGLAILAIASSLGMWNRIASNRIPVSPPIVFAAAVFSLGLISPFILRDLDDCGLQIFLLFFLTSAAYSSNSGRPVSTGFWLGVAATYKTTPLLFLPYLIWKRQWQSTVWMVVFIIILNLAPALFIGWNKTISSNLQWLKRAQLELKVQNLSSPTSFEVPRHQNQGLPFAIVRYLRTFPPGHPLYKGEHPLFFQFGSLEQATADKVAKCILLVLAAILAWRFRHQWGNGINKSELAPEWASVILLCALLSPLCWIHHFVLALPCVFLTIRAELQMRNTPTWRLIFLGFIGFKILIIQRFLLGYDLSLVMFSYKLDTLAVFLAMVLALTISSPHQENQAIFATEKLS